MSCPCIAKGNDYCCEIREWKEDGELIRVIGEETGCEFKRDDIAKFLATSFMKRLKIQVHVDMRMPVYPHPLRRYVPLTYTDYKLLAIAVGVEVAKEILRKVER